MQQQKIADTSAVRYQIRSLKNGSRFIHRYEADGYVQQIDTLREQIIAFSRESPLEATKLLSSLLDSHIALCNRIDDSDGAVGTAYGVVVEDLGKLYRGCAIHFSQEYSVQEVLKRIFDNPFGIHENGKVGWPDDKGNVWVPTGPGSKAHGGPHWDVQHHNGI